MRVIAGFPDAPAWAAAARHLGHEAHALDYRNALVQFAAVRPEVVLVDRARLDPGARAPVDAALARHPRAAAATLDGATVTFGRPTAPYPLEPATRFLPDFPGGRWRPEFLCHVLVTEPPRPDREAAVDRWLAAGLAVKLVGPDPWPFPQYVGAVSPAELWDAAASARQVADFALTPAARLDVVACGGNPVPAAGVAAEPTQFPYERAEVLARHTLVNRLADILARLAP